MHDYNLHAITIGYKDYFTFDLWWMQASKQTKTCFWRNFEFEHEQF